MQEEPLSSKCRQGQALPCALSSRSSGLCALLLLWVCLAVAALQCEGIRRPTSGSLGGNGVTLNPGRKPCVLAAALNSSTCRKRVGPASSDLGVFAARLGLGELRCIDTAGRFLHVSPPPAAAAKTSEAAGEEGEGQAVAARHRAHQAAADFLGACPVYFVADAGGRLLAASYRAADPHVIPPLTAATTTAAATTRAAAAASTPARAALSVGVYFMSPVDAADYLHAITGGGSPSSLTIRAVPLSNAYASLRYIHPKLRLEAARAAASFSSRRSFPLLSRLSLAVQHLLGGEGGGSKLRCVLLPDTQTLEEEIKRKGGDPFRGVPVFSLPPIKAQRGSSLHALLTQQRQQQSTASSTAATSYYQLVPVETSSNHWVLAVQFEGGLRQPFFCSREDALKAYEAFAAKLPSRLLSAHTTLRVHTLEGLLDKLALRASSSSRLYADDTNNMHGLMRPLLLPALKNFL
ncbi:hypothetical protein Emed_004534 [Eimeria media]